jgi:hypothetical protein
MPQNHYEFFPPSFLQPTKCAVLPVYMQQSETIKTNKVSETDLVLRYPQFFCGNKIEWK